jgi:hypothetical protein
MKHQHLTMLGMLRLCRAAVKDDFDEDDITLPK